MRKIEMEIKQVIDEDLFVDIAMNSKVPIKMHIVGGAF